MGSKWTVMAWVPDSNVSIGFVWSSVYNGESALSAVLAAVKAKRNGAGCVKVEWR